VRENLSDGMFSGWKSEIIKTSFEPRLPAPMRAASTQCRLISQQRWNPAVEAFWPGHDLMAPKFRPLFRRLNILISSPNNCVLALGNPNQFGLFLLVLLVFIFHFHECQGTKGGWTFTVQPNIFRPGNYLPPRVPRQTGESFGNVLDRVSV
jgi:hypothetical protein